jgi:SPP1 family predicted phage head-tail adaptor
VQIKQHKIDAGTTGYDTFGQVSISSTAWTNIFTRRAKIEQLSGVEAERARQLYPMATYRVTVDYDSKIGSTGGNRKVVMYRGRQLFVGAILNPDLENVQLELLCGEER